MSVCEMSVEEVSVDDMSVDKMPVDAVSMVPMGCHITNSINTVCFGT